MKKRITERRNHPTAKEVASLQGKLLTKQLAGIPFAVESKEEKEQPAKQLVCFRQLVAKQDPALTPPLHLNWLAHAANWVSYLEHWVGREALAGPELLQVFVPSGLHIQSPRLASKQSVSTLHLVRGAGAAHFRETGLQVSPAAHSPVLAQTPPEATLKAVTQTPPAPQTDVTALHPPGFATQLAPLAISAVHIPLLQ